MDRSEISECLTGEVPGDYGCDPFGLNERPEDFAKYQAYKLSHGSWVMFGVAGFVIPDGYYPPREDSLRHEPKTDVGTLMHACISGTRPTISAALTEKVITQSDIMHATGGTAPKEAESLKDCWLRKP